MTKLKLLGAAAMLSMLIATPALAEPMNQEPGLAAFYHPNSDPNVGSAPVDAMALDTVRGRGMMVMKMKVKTHPVHTQQ
jgi:hypothetical protein